MNGLRRMIKALLWTVFSAGDLFYQTDVGKTISLKSAMLRTMRLKKLLSNDT